MKKAILFVLAVIGMGFILSVSFQAVVGRTGTAIFSSTGISAGTYAGGNAHPLAEPKNVTIDKSTDNFAAMTTTSSTPAPINNDGSQVVKKRMIIRDAYLTLQTNHIDTLMQQIAQLADSSGGYVVSSKMTQSDQAGENSYAEISIRVPAEGLDNILTRLRTLATRVESEETSGEDITEKYFDIEAKLNNLQISKNQLTKIMEQAKSIKDILNIQKQLSDTQEQMGVFEGYMKYFRESVALSLITIRLQMNPDIKINEQPHWQFTETIKHSYQNLTVQLEHMTYGVIEFIVYYLPLIFLWSLLLLVVFFVGRKIYYLIISRGAS